MADRRAVGPYQSRTKARWRECEVELGHMGGGKASSREDASESLVYPPRTHITLEREVDSAHRRVDESESARSESILSNAAEGHRLEHRQDPNTVCCGPQIIPEAAPFRSIEGKKGN